MTELFADVLFQLGQMSTMLPLIAFQTTAVVGMLAAVMVVTRRHGWPTRWRGIYMGLVLGCTGYVITWFMADYMIGAVKLNLAMDVLLLGGWLGGLRGGLVCYAFLMLARWQFGGVDNLEGAMLDSAVPSLCGWLLHHLMPPQNRSRYPAWIALVLWLVRVFCSFAGLWLGFQALDEPLETLHALLGFRMLSLPFSLLLLYAAILLFDSDAQIDAQQAREYELTHKDLLSGLPNRRALSQWIQRFWCERVGQPSCLAVLELANLREFLLRFGQDRGGELWRQFADADAVGELSRNLTPFRPSFFQYGDFSLALHLEGVGLGALEQSQVVDRFVTHLCASMASCWPGFTPTMRCAVVDLDEGGAHPAKPIPYRNITLALSSLDAGVAYFNGIFKRDQLLDSHIESSLLAWIRHESEVPMQLQPKLRLRDRRVVGAEALLRMSDAQGQPISAMRALSVFQRHGRMAEFEWVSLRAVVRLLAAHVERLCGVGFATNISAASLQQPDFAERVKTLLQDEGVAPVALKLEVVEWSEVVSHPDVKRNLEQLTRDGIALSIDDFGAGYSNLLLLTQFPFSEVKIDHGLITAIAEPKALSVVRFIIDVAQRCRAEVVAEGIETPDIEARVRGLGADLGQGFLYARALPITEFLALLPAEPVAGSGA